MSHKQLFTEIYYTIMNLFLFYKLHVGIHKRMLKTDSAVFLKVSFYIGPLPFRIAQMYDYE